MMPIMTMIIMMVTPIMMMKMKNVYEPERAVSARHSFAREGRNPSIPPPAYNYHPHHHHYHHHHYHHRRRRRRHHHHTHRHHHHHHSFIITGSASAGKEGFEDGEGAQEARVDGGSGGHDDDDDDDEKSKWAIDRL